MTITLENIGKIGKFDFDFESFTMFLGKNDSGKTYASVSIWTLIKEIGNFCSDKRSKIFEDISKFIYSYENLKIVRKKQRKLIRIQSQR